MGPAQVLKVPSARGHSSLDSDSTSSNVPASTRGHNRSAHEEITAAIEGLRALKYPCKVTIITDSQYLFSGIQTWRHKWRRNGWAYRTYGEPIANADLWRLLDAELEKHAAHCEWVRSHNGEPDNERCDYLAKMSLRGAGPALPKRSSA